MRLILLASAALTLSACSSYDLFGNGFVGGAPHHASAHHNTGAAYGGYHSNAYDASNGYQTQIQNGYAYTGQAPAYDAPVHVNPTGQGYAHNGGVPALRGLSKGNAGPRYYSNLGAVMYDVEDEAFGIVGRLGVQHGVLGAELEGSAGLIDDTQRFTGTDANGLPITVKAAAGVQWSTAAFATARAPLTSRLSGLARAGYHITELEAKGSLNGQRIISDRVHSDGIAYGVGLEYAVDPRRALRLDYTRYGSDDFVTADSVSASFVSRF